MSIFSERLEELMFYNNIKSDELGKKLGLDGSTIRAWRSEKQFISLKNLIKTANYFNCSLDFLIGRTDKLLDFTPKECPPFYDRFKALIDDRGISLYKITKETTIKDSYFYLWRKGASPDVDCLVKLAEYLNVSLDFLVGRDT